MIPVWGYPAAAALALAGFSWRILRRWLIRRSLQVALHSPRENQRKVAVRECAEAGIAETAGMLVRHLRRETSPGVLRELAVALAERQWEPASKASVLKLRIWAREYGLEHPEALADVKKITGLAGHAPAAEGEPAAEARSAAPAPDPAPSGGQAAPEPPAASGPPAVAEVAEPEPGRERRPAGPGAPVAPATVLVSGASSPAAVTTIGELHRLGHRVVAADPSQQAPGLRLADVSTVLPPPDDPGFAACIRQAARAHGAAAMICTSAAEQMALYAAREELSAGGVRWTPARPDAVRACTDPAHLRGVLADSGLRVPPEQPAPSQRTGLREFTADMLMGEDGQAAGLVTHWRLETTAGLSNKAETFTEDRVVDACIRAAKAMRLTGPVSLRGSVTGGGEPVLAGAWPYYSVDLALSLRAGADFVGQHLRQLFGLPVQVETLRARTGVIMIREIRETFEE